MGAGAVRFEEVTIQAGQDVDRGKRVQMSQEKWRHLRVHKSEWLMTKVQDYVREVAERRRHQPWLSSGWDEWTKPGLESVGGDFSLQCYPREEQVGGGSNVSCALSWMMKKPRK